jgi:ferredoxin
VACNDRCVCEGCKNCTDRLKDVSEKEKLYNTAIKRSIINGEMSAEEEDEEMDQEKSKHEHSHN